MTNKIINLVKQLPPQEPRKLPKFAQVIYVGLGAIGGVIVSALLGSLILYYGLCLIVTTAKWISSDPACMGGQYCVDELSNGYKWFVIVGWVVVAALFGLFVGFLEVFGKESE